MDLDDLLSHGLESDPTYQDLVAHRNLLQTHYDDIARRGNISRAEAETLVQYCAEQFQDLPLTSFTLHPSTTNLQPATEGLLHAVGEAAVKVIKQAVKLLLEFLKALWDFILKLSGLRKTLESSPERIEAFEGFLSAVMSLTHGIQDTDPALRLDMVERKRIEETFNRGLKQAHCDLFHSGTYGALFAKCILVAEHTTLPKVMDRLDLFDKTLLELRKERHDEPDALDSYRFLFENLAKPLPGTDYRPSLKSTHVKRLESLQKQDFVDVVSEISNDYGDLRVSPPVNSHDTLLSFIDISMATHGPASWRDNIPALISKGKFYDGLKACQKRIQDIESHFESSQYPDSIWPELTQAFGCIRREVSALATLLSRNNQVYDDQVYIAAGIESYLLQLCKIAKKKAELADPHNAEDTQKAMRQLQMALDRLK